jgi:hypothetical protein
MQVVSLTVLFSVTGIVTALSNYQTNRAFKKLAKAAASEAQIHPEPYWGALKDTPAYAQKGDIDSVVKKKVRDRNEVIRVTFLSSIM